MCAWKDFAKILLKRLYQNSVESCLLRKTLPKLTVWSCDSRSRVRTFVDLCGFECSKSCVVEKTLPEFSRIMSAKNDFAKILLKRLYQSHVCLERLWQNWQPGHVTPGYMGLRNSGLGLQKRLREIFFKVATSRLHMFSYVIWCGHCNLSEILAKSFLSRQITDFYIHTSGRRSYTLQKILQTYGHLPPSIHEILKKKLKKSIYRLSRKLKKSLLWYSLKIWQSLFKQAKYRLLHTWPWGEVLHPPKNSENLWASAPIYTRNFKKKILKIDTLIV